MNFVGFFAGVGAFLLLVMGASLFFLGLENVLLNGIYPII
jgi:hypothetical protein